MPALKIVTGKPKALKKSSWLRNVDGNNGDSRVSICPTIPYQANATAAHRLSLPKEIKPVFATPFAV